MLLLPTIFALAAVGPTSDPFEVQVYTYDTVPQGHVEIEQHNNVTTENGAHITWEFKYGIVSWFEVAAYLATEVASGTGDYGVAEGRFRVRPRTPDGWPVRASLNIESVFDGDGFASLELRPIFTQPVGRRLFIHLAPAFEYEKGVGFELKSAAKVSLLLVEGVEAGLEYYNALGAIASPVALSQQWHQLYVVTDLARWEPVDINVGIGFGLNDVTDPVSGKLIVGIAF